MWGDGELQRATDLDRNDNLKHLREDFFLPDASFIGKSKASVKDDDSPVDSPIKATRSIYLCGNSLGLQPKMTEALVLEELEVWRKEGVYGHHTHPKGRPWININETVIDGMATLVGALPSEVAVMGTLTSNLHTLMATFYRPNPTRYKIIIEAKAFPSDQYAVQSQVLWHGFDPAVSIVEVAPKIGSHTLDKDNIFDAIDTHADTAALILFSGIQYYTGQLFDIESITAYAKARGITVGWDLAHAAGNVVLKLHDWGVDFAAWCSYKYINAGPGSIAAIFVHEHHSNRPRLSGWWGHDKETRFAMGTEFIPIPGAAGFQHSNPSVLATVCLLASLQVFHKTDMEALRSKSEKLTGYLEELLLSDSESYQHYEIITPRNPSERGAQLSLLFKDDIMQPVHTALELRGIFVDERKPNVIRVAPAPLYNTFEDVFRFATQLKTAIAAVRMASKLKE